MEWEYVAPRLGVSMFCSGGGWTGDLPPQGSQIAFWGIVRVSFWYRFFVQHGSKDVQVQDKLFCVTCFQRWFFRFGELREMGLISQLRISLLLEVLGAGVSPFA